jgi:hypothetical protein
VETTERFPPVLGNLATEREIPTFPPPILVNDRKNETKEDWTASLDSGTLNARSDEGTPGGKVLKIRGPYLLQTDKITVGPELLQPTVLLLQLAETWTSAGSSVPKCFRDQ